MAEFNDTYHKAGVLMKSALKKYDEGDYEGGDRDRKEANRMYDLAEKEVDSAQGTAMLYGENRNFGTIYKVFESNAPKLFKTKNGGSKIKKVLGFIKENKVLKAEFDVYNALVYPNTVTNAEYYVNEAVTALPAFKKKEIVENNQKFINLIREMKLDELVTMTDEEAKLFESIEYLLLNKKSFKNLNEYANAKKCIVEHIENKSDDINSVNENKTIDEIYNSTVNEMQKKYEESLNDDERKLIESLTSIEDKEKYFNEKKNEATDILREQMEYCDGDKKGSIQNIIENIDKMMYSEASFIPNVAEFIEIINTINE
jgi:hypothetical protein